ncbi:MAG: hypothetical protein AABY22_17430, partial [Nanoarchaeota archaeon]
EIENKKYWLGTSLISFGNSGGGVFRLGESNNFEFIGVPSRVQLQGFGDVANWMGYFIPASRVFEFLKKNNYDFIFDSSLNIDECDKKRKESIEKERDKVEKKEGVVQ